MTPILYTTKTGVFVGVFIPVLNREGAKTISSIEDRVQTQRYSFHPAMYQQWWFKAPLSNTSIGVKNRQFHLIEERNTNLLRFLMCALSYQAAFSLLLIECMSLSGLDMDHNWESLASVSQGLNTGDK